MNEKRRTQNAKGTLVSHDFSRGIEKARMSEPEFSISDLNDYVSTATKKLSAFVAIIKANFM